MPAHSLLPRLESYEDIELTTSSSDAVERQTTSTGKLRSKWRENLGTLFWALGIALIIRAVFFQSFSVPTSSMQPNILAGDRIVVSKYAYGYGPQSFHPLPLPKAPTHWLAREPKRGDVVVFRDPISKITYAKRVVGLPGETITIDAGEVSIDSVPLPLEFLSEVTSIDAGGNPALTEVLREMLPSGASYPIYDRQKNSDLDTLQALKVPMGHFFVLGDSRDLSNDSRLTRAQGGMGFVSQNELVGRAEFVIVSVEEGFSIFKPMSWGKLRARRSFKDIP